MPILSTLNILVSLHHCFLEGVLTLPALASQEYDKFTPEPKLVIFWSFNGMLAH